MNKRTKTNINDNELSTSTGAGTKIEQQHLMDEDRLVFGLSWLRGKPAVTDPCFVFDEKWVLRFLLDPNVWLMGN